MALSGNEFVSAEDLGIPADDYVLGLADVVGELRRLTLDALREGDVKKAEKYLETMDEIYIELLALDEALTETEYLEFRKAIEESF